jgi:hypothetical protein
MELKIKNNIWLFLYRMWTGKAESLPNTICPLFWGGIMGFFTIILSPLFILLCILIWVFGKFKEPFIEIREDHFEGNGLIFIGYSSLFTFLIFMSEIAGLGTLGYINDNGTMLHTTPWYVYISVWLFWPALITILGFLIVGVGGLFNYFKYRGIRYKKPSVASQGIKDFYNKYCTRIEWK